MAAALASDAGVGGSSSSCAIAVTAVTIARLTFVNPLTTRAVVEEILATMD